MSTPSTGDDAAAGRGVAGPAAGRGANGPAAGRGANGPAAGRGANGPAAGRGAGGGQEVGVGGGAPIRVVIADDHALIRSGLSGMLGAQPDIEVIDAVADGAAAIAAAERLRPEVVVMDIRMPGVNGIDATRRIRRAPDAPRVLVLTTFDLDEYVYEALRAGAGGFLLKDAPPGQLAEAVRTVAGGEELLAPAVTRRLISRFLRVPPSHRAAERLAATLTERELDVLRELAAGRSNTEIAGRLHISEATAKTHVSRVLTKLDLRDRVQAVVYAYENGVVSPGAPDGG